MQDTRSWFDNIVARKISSWDEAPLRKLSDMHLSAVMEKPRRLITRDDNITPFSALFKEGGQMEWVVERIGGQSPEYYYVNTEGYGYARYCFKFLPRAI